MCDPSDPLFDSCVAASVHTSHNMSDVCIESPCAGAWLGFPKRHVWVHAPMVWLRVELLWLPAVAACCGCLLWLPAVPQKCGYLCNMAVSKQWRRRGIAGTLLTAIEDMCLLAGEAATHQWAGIHVHVHVDHAWHQLHPGHDVLCRGWFVSSQQQRSRAASGGQTGPGIRFASHAQHACVQRTPCAADPSGIMTVAYTLASTVTTAWT